MFDKRKFTISIGEYGIIIALHNGSNVQNKILVVDLNEENRVRLEDLFNKNKSAPIYILIDTANQSYNRKSYPPVSASDFHKIVKRHLSKEFDYNEKSFQNYYGYKDKSQNKWECIFVSAPRSAEIEKWIEFLIGLHNELIGIYMLPIETINLATSIFDFVKVDRKNIVNKNSALSLIVQNKVSGIRQIVFSNNVIVFTRVVSYDFDDKNFADTFEQDIFRANEYLKMILPNLKTQDIAVINVLSDKIIEKIKHFTNRDINFINYQPFQIASKISITNAITKNNNGFSDILIANLFANNPKKTLKFPNPNITLLSRLNLIIKSIKVLNYIIIVGMVFVFANIILQGYKYRSRTIKFKLEENVLKNRIQEISSDALDFDGKSNNKSENDILASRIIDFGKIYEHLSNSDADISHVFNQLGFIKKYGGSVTSFGYQIPNYNPTSISFTAGIFSIALDLSDSGGDIEVLFKKFDNLTLDTKNKFPGYNIKYSEAPKNIDFGKKYYAIPFDLTIENKAQGNPNVK